ncbi:hypothetical protein [Dyadobacter pollutisoli]|uniref:Uncharacterized protein n=1 Tax=Dyadobacter pollutisoli TaxID=2910158 RepID=A0A9E8NEL5_9BACT|nr:hypothetical protein [Dyadobacter pollutisoli]WAC15340.1 hypothetical protein ON006_15505 [Dyadobacter pollutisoli]
MAHTTMTIEMEDDEHPARLEEFIHHNLGLPPKSFTTRKQLSEEEALRLLERVAGSWEGNETGDELNAMIRNARIDNHRDVEL